MNQSTPATKAPTPEPLHKPSTIDALMDDARRNPARYAKRAAMVAIPLLLVIIGVQFWRSHRAKQAGDVATRWSDTWSGDTTAKSRAAQLEQLGADLKSPDQQAMRHYDLAVTYKELAEQATTQEEKLDYYGRMVKAAQDLKALAPNSLWAKMPVRPTSTTAPAPSAVDQIIEIGTKQLAWLKAHPFQTAPEADPGLKLTFELDDGRKFVVGKLFSRSAPFHVQNFVELARRGYFEGTGLSKLAQGYKKGTQPKQGTTPTAIAIEAGHPMTKVTPDDREDDDGASEIGYSVREEPNSLPMARGRIVAVQDPQSGGDSPSRFKIYAEEPTYAFETVFAEVTEGLDVVDALVNAPANETRPTRPRDLVRIKKVIVEGSVLAPPERPFPPELKLPDSRPETRKR